MSSRVPFRVGPGAVAGAWLVVLALGAPVDAHAPHDLATAVAVSPDFAHDGLVFAQFQLIDQRVFGRSTDGGATWRELGLPMAERMVLEFAFSPAFAVDGTAFACTDDGVYRSHDRGLSWQALSVGPGPLAPRDLAVSPAFAEDGVVLLATTSGLWRTTDGGDSWSEASAGLGESSLGAVTFAPDDAGLAYCAGASLHASSDGGASWAVTRAFTDDVVEIACSPQHATDGRLALAFAATGIQRSETFGASWQVWDAGLEEDHLLDVDVAADGTWFASGREAGAFLADGFGAPWRLEDTGLEPWDETTQDHYREVRPSPDYASDGTAFLATTEGLYVTHDRGASWSGQDICHQRIHVRLAVSPDFARDGAVFSANYGGGAFVWRQPVAGVGGRDGSRGMQVSGDTALGLAVAAGGQGPAAGPGPLHDPTLPGWSARATGLKSLWTDALVVSPTFARDRTLYQSYVGLQRSVDGGATWVPVPLPPGVLIVRDVALSPAHADDGVVFIGTNGVGTYRSDDDGASWVDVSADLPVGFRTRRLLLSPDFPVDRTVVAASWDHGVWLSADAGLTWEPRNAGLSQPGVQSLALSPSFHLDGTLLAGNKTQGLHMSTDAGLSWQRVSDSFDVDDLFVTSGVAFSPDWAVDGTAFATTLAGGIHRTTDGGQTWQRADDGFAWTAARDVMLSPDFARDDTVFVASHEGVWRSEDRGDSWQPLPPFARVDDGHPLVVASGAWTSPILAGVNGRGVAVSAQPGARREIDLYGRELSWHAVRAPDAGRARVHVDGQLAAEIDLYAPALEPAEVFAQDFAEPGWHHVSVTVVGTSHPASSDVVVASDGFTQR